MWSVRPILFGASAPVINVWYSSKRNFSGAESSKLEKARELGATDVINAAKEDAVAAIQAATGGWGADFGFEAIGKPDIITQAYNATRPGGMTVVLGIAPLGSTFTVELPLPRPGPADLRRQRVGARARPRADRGEPARALRASPGDGGGGERPGAGPPVAA